MNQRFKVTLSWEYEIAPAEAKEGYGTTDPAEMAEIDRQNFVEDPGAIAGDLIQYPYSVVVAPVVENSTVAQEAAEGLDEVGQDLFDRLWLAMPSADDDEAMVKARKLIDDFAHELAEKIRREADERDRLSRRALAAAFRLVADLVDPYAKHKDSSVSS